MCFRTDYQCSGDNAAIPQYTGIVVDGFTAADSAPGAYSESQGYDASDPLELYLARVHLDATAHSSMNQYARVGLDNSNIVPAGTGVTTFPFTMPTPIR